jgi:hypothetical protein
MGGIVECPAKWFSFNGKCYRVNQDTTDYYGAKLWCDERDAKLISINAAEENHFLWRICHTEQAPLTYPRNGTRATCWIGIYEKQGSGDVDTPQVDQVWEWLDGTSVAENMYSNWALKPGLGNGDGDGNSYFEPNNEKTRRTPLGQDVRHAIINQLEGGMSGKWYDKPAQFRAHAACEMDPAALDGAPAPAPAAI